jgi:hypothetical protein
VQGRIGGRTEAMTLPVQAYQEVVAGVGQPRGIRSGTGQATQSVESDPVGLP